MSDARERMRAAYEATVREKFAPFTRDPYKGGDVREISDEPACEWADDSTRSFTALHGDPGADVQSKRELMSVGRVVGARAVDGDRCATCRKVGLREWPDGAEQLVCLSAVHVAKDGQATYAEVHPLWWCAQYAPNKTTP